MESIKHKLGIAILVIGLIASAALIWYLIAAAPDSGGTEGTLVELLGKAGQIAG